MALTLHSLSFLYQKALTTLEASTCLAVNQASSIQSLGGTCESITIGHNKSKLPLSHKAIFLETGKFILHILTAARSRY